MILIVQTLSKKRMCQYLEKWKQVTGLSFYMQITVVEWNSNLNGFG